MASRRQRRWRALTQPSRYAALAAGALPILAFPALNLEFLGWCGLVPGLLLIRAAPSAREAAVRGWWLGTGFLLAALYWLAPNLGPGLLLVAIVFGVLWTGFGAAGWLLLRAPLTPGRALAALAVLPSYWLFTEWARSWQGFGGPWAVLGTSQWQHPVVLALASVGGVWLISFALVAVNTGLVILLLARRNAVRLAGAAGVAVALAAGPVAFALTPAVPPVRYVTAALVQQGIQPSRASRVNASLRLSEGLGADRPDLIVWGESSVGYDIERADTGLLDRIEALAARTGAEILVNQDSALPTGGKSKVALLIGPHGVIGSYVKTRLVPFGEYIPFRGALGWLTSISQAAPSNMIPGDGAHLIHAVDRAGRPLPLGVLICFESAFPDMARVDADLGAQLIIYQTSDSTFQQSWAPAQHASLSAVRAAETGRPVVQAALTGDTAAFDARGRLLAMMTTARRGVTVLRIGLPPGSARTPYDRLGDYVPWAATIVVACTAVGWLAAGRRNRRGRVPLEGNFRPAGYVSVSGAPAILGRSAEPGRKRRTRMSLAPPDRAAFPTWAALSKTAVPPGNLTRRGAQATGDATGDWRSYRQQEGCRVRESDNAPGQQRLAWARTAAGRLGRGRTAPRRAPHRAPQRLAGLAAVTAAAGLLIAACSSGSPTSSGPGGQPSGKSGAAGVTAASAALSITPANGARTANPAQGVTVKAGDGKIRSVTVTTGHDPVSGSANASHTVWHSSWALQPSRDYTVRATAVNPAGKTVTSVSRFRTLTPGATDTAMIFEGYKQSYGVGIPIRITFSSPVANRAAVERSLEVTSSTPVTGAWYWDGNQTLYFRTMNYWPANTTVTFDGHLDGVEAAPGVYFTADLTQTFGIGPSLIVVASTRTHYLNVFYQGKLWGHWPISTGRPGLDTVDGTYITLEKGNPVRMVGNGYDELVNDAVRFTYSGDYLHSAPWSVGEQGYTNVSHGCVNLSPEHAAMYYNLATPGDPVTITGSPAAGHWDDGFTVWFLTWKQLLKGSALGMAVQAGPSGSTFVSPSSVTEQPLTSRLAGPKPGNSAAQS